MAQAQMIGEALSMVRRHLLMIVAITTIGGFAAVLYALSRPPVYETSVKVLVESQQIPDELARSTVNLSAAARLQLIEQRLMARESAAELIDRLGLFADLHQPMQAKVDLLRHSTHIESISAPGANPYGNAGSLVAFTITVRLGDAAKTAEVANDLAQNAIHQNLEVRAGRASETLAYFEAEQRRIGDQLKGAEERLSAFKQTNQGALPEDLGPSREALARIQTAEIDLDRQLLDLELRRSELEAMLAGATPTIGTATTSQTELDRLEVELATRRRVLAPNHPELRGLEQRLEAVRALVAGSTKGKDGTPPPRSAAIRQQADQIGAETAQMRARREELRAERARIDAALTRNPGVDATLQAMERTVEELRERYSDVARRQAEARTGVQLEANQQSERFEILEAALVPDHPIGPNRKKIAAGGLLASGVVAVGLMMLIEMLRPAIRTSAQMERQLDLRPVVSIPYVRVPGERMRRIALWCGVGALTVAAVWLVLPVVDRYVAPLDALKERIERHIGSLGEGGTEEPGQG